MGAIVTALLPVLLKLIGYALDKNKAAVDSKKSWLELVKLIEKDLGKSVSLNDNDRAQADDLHRQWEEKYGKKPSDS